MIKVDYYERNNDFVIRIRLHNEMERDRLASVFHLMAEGEARPLDLARQDGFSFTGIETLLLGVVDKMRLETVTVRDKEVNWAKTAEGWLEAFDLVNGLTGSSHQILGDGDATIEVELGAG
jgi:hypothetical protein